MALSQTRAFVTSLLTSLGPPSDPTSQNPLKALPKEKRNLLLTLQLLYPNELLPALDLLDRELVTKLNLQSPCSDTTTTTTTTNTTDAPRSQTAPTPTQPRTAAGKGSIYYVRSAQSPTSSSSNNTPKSRYRDPLASTTHYEVRTTSWSCSCPAFAFSAFPAPGSQRAPIDPAPLAQLRSPAEEHQENEDPAAEGREEWCAGGLGTGDAVPVCKHLLACVLAERSGLLGGFVREREVGLEEMVGWAAGWGG